MRVILIDAFTKSISEIQCGETQKDIAKALGATNITKISINKVGDYLCLDNDLPESPAKHHYFYFCGQMMPGIGILVNIDENGVHRSPILGLSRLIETQSVSFLDNKMIPML